MKIKKIILILILAVVIISAWNLIRNWNDIITPQCVYVENTKPQSPKEFIQDTSDLIFLSDSDKQKIFSAIDSATSAKDFDYKFIFSLTEVLDSYNNAENHPKELLLAPEILSDDPKSINITSHGCKSDLLAGLDLSPIGKEDLSNLKSFGRLFIEETSRYPLAWWNVAIPPFVVFVKAVKVNGEIVGGVEQGAIIYNISDIDNYRWSMKITHHELMHWVELATGSRTDPAWPGTAESYLKKYNLTSQFNFAEHPQPGFVTGYAKTNIAEDKAELYSYLFNPEGYQKLKNWEKNDPELKAKVRYLKDFIRARYEKMDDEFFESYSGSYTFE